MMAINVNGLIPDNLFIGQKVCLKLGEPEAAGKQFSHWQRNSTYGRLLDTDPTVLWSAKKIKEWVEKDNSEDSHQLLFHIHILEDDRWIGFMDLYVNDWVSMNTWVGIGIGEADAWSQGYGTDAMKVALRYAFLELGVPAVNLGVFAYNSRAQRSYQKAGFRMVGKERGRLQRDGERADVLYMIVTADEWLQENGYGR